MMRFVRYWDGFVRLADDESVRPSPDTEPRPQIRRVRRVRRAQELSTVPIRDERLDSCRDVGVAFSWFPAQFRSCRQPRAYRSFGLTLRDAYLMLPLVPAFALGALRLSSVLSAIDVRE